VASPISPFRLNACANLHLPSLLPSSLLTFPASQNLWQNYRKFVGKQVCGVEFVWEARIYATRSTNEVG